MKHILPNLLGLSVLTLIIGGIIKIDLIDLKSRKVADSCGSWPTAEGIVEEVKMDIAHFGLGFYKKQCHLIFVHYTFKVDGQTYQSNRLSYHPSNSVRNYLIGKSPGRLRRIYEMDTHRCYHKYIEATRVANSYHRNQRVRVHYNPSDPTMSCLEGYPGEIYHAWYILKLLARAALMLSVFLYFMQRAGRQMTSQQHRSPIKAGDGAVNE